MVGITSFGAYIPYYYLNREDIAKIWGRSHGSGQKSVAYFDEDSLTMSVAACKDCLNGINTSSMDRLYFSSTTAPYWEKQSASVIATALDLAQEIFTVDFSGSLRSGTNAMKAAMDAVACGSARQVIICASDVRLGLPQGDKEMTIGDGAGSLIIGDQKTIANILCNYSVSNEVIDVWRSDRDNYVHMWESRFVRDEAYGRSIIDGVTTVLKNYNYSNKDFSKVIFSGPNAEYVNYIAKRLGFDTKTQVENRLYGSVGDTGTALPIMILISVLEDAKPGDKILLVNYADGCNIFVFEVTEEINNMRNRQGIKGHLKARKQICYHEYLRWREILPTEPPARPPADQSRPSAVALWRDRKGGMALYGVKCKNCGTPQYPAQRVCYKCRSKDEFEDYSFSDKRARLTSFSHDLVSYSLDPPTTICAVDFEGGGRIMCDMTDRDPGQVKVGMQVEMTFRRLFYRADFYSYWWKCKPVRNSEQESGE